jgi:putative tricarboxylic transport membrane protein
MASRAGNMTERPFERDLAKDIEDKVVLMKELGLA